MIHKMPIDPSFRELARALYERLGGRSRYVNQSERAVPPWSRRASAGTGGGEQGVVVNLAAHARADTPALARATV
jgi:hypothetical protein